VPSKSQLGWLSLLQSFSTTTASDCQTMSGQIQGDEPEQGVDDRGRKEFDKSKVLRREWKSPCEMSTTGHVYCDDDGQLIVLSSCQQHGDLHNHRAAVWRKSRKWSSPPFGVRLQGNTFMSGGTNRTNLQIWFLHS